MTAAVWGAPRALREIFVPRFVLRLLFELQMRPRLLMTLHALLLIYVILVVLAPPALAAPGNPLSGLDRNDSTGHPISAYGIEYTVEGWGLDPMFTAMFGKGVAFLWELYRWLVGIAALLVEFTLTFKWVDWLAYPIEQAAIAFQSVLDQLPMARELLISLAIGIGLARMYFGQGAKGLSEMLFSLSAWGISAAVVVNPVTWLVGQNGVVTNVKLAGQTFVAQVADPTADVSTADPATGATKLAAAMVDIFVRKPHQFIAYGGLVDGGGCEATYNDNLSKTAKELADAMATCSPDFAETIKNPGPLTLVTMLIVLAGALILLGMACAIAGFAIFEIANILLGGLMLVWELFRSVGPAGSWRGAVSVLMSIAGSVLLLLLGLIVNVMYLSVVQYVFTQKEENTILLFLLVDLVMVISVLVLVTQRKKMHAAMERMRRRASGKKESGIPNPSTLSPRAMRRGMLTAAAVPGAMQLAGPAGSKLARATSSAAKRTRGAVRGGSRVVTSPARVVTRKLTRPGLAEGNLLANVARKTGAGRLATGQVRAAAFAGGEKRWMKKEAQREAKAEQRAERKQQRQATREQNRSWTWGGARRTALRQEGATARGRTSRRAAKSAAARKADPRRQRSAATRARKAPVNPGASRAAGQSPRPAAPTTGRRQPQRRLSGGQGGSAPRTPSTTGPTSGAAPQRPTRQPQRRLSGGQGGSAPRTPPTTGPTNGPAPKRPTRQQQNPSRGKRPAQKKKTSAATKSRKSRRRKK